MRVLLAAVAAIVVVAAILLSARELRGGDRARIAGVKSPDGTAARSLIVLEGADGAAQHLIRVHTPADGAHARLAELGSVEFSWAPVAGARAYMFLANNEFGDLVWRANTKDTTMTLPAKAQSQLIVGDRLKWLVQVPSLSASSDLNRLVLE